jgi:hypothetical protein
MRKPTERLSPLASSSRLRTAFSRPGSTVKTRKIAASVSGLRTACGSAAFTSRRTLRNLNIVVATVVNPSSSGYAETVQRLSDALE